VVGLKVKINEIEKDEDIYPRQQISHKTIESYVEALKAGAVFPPITAQRISVDSKVKTICLDGWHRLLAYKEYNRLPDVKPIEEVEVIYWKEEVLDKKTWLNELRLESAFRNIFHGDRLSMEDRKSLAQKIVELDPKIENKVLARKLGVTEWTITQWVKEIRDKYYASRDAFMYRLKLLGWSLTEIGEIYGISKETVYESLGKFSKLNLPNDFYERHKPVEEIAKYYHLDIPLTWAIILDGKSDIERFELFGKPEYGNEKPEVYNVWNFERRDPRLGDEVPGNIPGQIVMNLLYYYTNQGDLVVDPMAGGGSTIDACLVMGRRCRAYDIEPRRKDIIKRDVIKQGFDEKVVGKCDLILLDPPYYNMVFNSFKDLDDFYDFIEALARNSHSAIKPGGVVALLMSDWTKTEPHICLSGECYKIFTNHFTCIEHIDVPLTSAQYSGEAVIQAKKDRKLLGIRRSLYVFKKAD
jgi:hypothetical protein